jgi:signal transduction histidine kinase
MQDSLNQHIGDIQKMHEETEKRNEELQRASLLAEESDRQKTVFIQNMTHQIRTPLNIIMGFAQILRDNVTDLPVGEIRKMADMMEHNAMTLNRMVLMLYDSSDSGVSDEMNSQKYESVSCNEIARDSIANISLHFPDLSVHFETRIPDSLSINTSRLYLMRSLREILYNSAKYSDGPSILMSVTQTEKTIRYVIEDKGKGIAEADRELVFEPFTKIDDLSEGLGLGLPLAKRHFHNMGGDLKLDASYHDGCRIIMELPR